MYNARNNKTADMFDPFPQFGPKRRGLLKNSWAQFFRNEILPVLPAHLLRDHFHASIGRPTKEIFTMLGIMVLQQTFDLPDEEASSQVAFNQQWHYALDIRGNADEATYICPRTIFNMRELLVEQDLAKAIFEPITAHIAKLFELDTSKQRMDSMHFQSNMRHLGRVALFARTIEKFLRNLKRHHKAVFDSLDDDILSRYLAKRGESTFAMVKPSEAGRTLEVMARDLFKLVELFHESGPIRCMNSYQLLVRLLNEQCIIEPSPEAVQKISVKPNKDVPCNSLQSPVDPDAGYSGHKGKGYQAQIMETYDDSAEQDNNEGKQLSLITYIDVEPAHASDANALLPAIEDTQKRALGPTEVLVDSAYGGDDNHQAAAEAGVDIVAPTMGTPKVETKIPLHEFKLNKAGKVLSCPQGHAPESVRLKKQRYLAKFNLAICQQCPRREQCPAKLRDSKCSLGYYEKAGRIAARRAFEQTQEFRDKYRSRAGIEGTNSLIARLTGIKRLRVRGLKAVQFAAIMKAAGINILRATACKSRGNKRANGYNGSCLPAFPPLFSLILFFKELFWKITCRVVKFSRTNANNNVYLPVLPV
jgi:hypothetical protein